MSKAHEIVRTGISRSSFAGSPMTGRLRCGSCLAAGRAVRSVRTVGVAGCRNAVPVPRVSQAFLGDEPHPHARLEVGRSNVAAGDLLDCGEPEGPVVGAARRRPGRHRRRRGTWRTASAKHSQKADSPALRPGRGRRDVHRRQGPQPPRPQGRSGQDRRDRCQRPPHRHCRRHTGARGHHRHSDRDGCRHHPPGCGGLHRRQPHLRPTRGELPMEEALVGADTSATLIPAMDGGTGS